jgi:GT2 family glycosyltransferase
MPPWAVDLDLRPVSRWPTRLSEATAAAVMAAPLPKPSRLGFSRPAAEPRASIVVVTWDNLLFNRLCLECLLDLTEDGSCEIVVVDNGSTDGTAEYLKQLAERYPQFRVFFNDCNRGFAVGNNQALASARGECLVFLNNDTVPAPGWLPRLLAHLDDPRIGLAGPVTNRSGNESQIETAYRTYGEYAAFAEERWRGHRGEHTDIRVATMFCAAMRRDVYQKIGPLDERFEIGLFEDDDYSMRIRQAGYRVVCAEDVFLHHFGQTSIGKLAEAGRYGGLFHANRRRWEEKWRQAWEPYNMRPNPAYDAAVTRIRKIVRKAIPAGSRVLVVSKGDDALLDLPGVQAEHFPQAGDGGYSGYNPADGVAAVQELETLRSRGAKYLLIPATALWWLDHYAEFRRYLENRCLEVHCDSHCLIVNLNV